jgi:hypothetical protein
VDVEMCDPVITKSVENYAGHTYSRKSRIRYVANM